MYRLSKLLESVLHRHTPLDLTDSFVEQFLSIATIGEFVRVQFSGDLLDTLGITILCRFWVFRFVLRIAPQSSET